MRSSTAKSLKKKLQDFCERKGIVYTNAMYKELKRMYKETPVAERAKVFGM